MKLCAFKLINTLTSHFSFYKTSYKNLSYIVNPLELFQKKSNHGSQNIPEGRSIIQTCSILLSINKSLVAFEQNLYNLFHGWPLRRLCIGTNDSKIENTTQFIQVTGFLDLLIQCINYRIAFLNVTPCPLGKGCVFITIISFPSSC